MRRFTVKLTKCFLLVPTLNQQYESYFIVSTLICNNNSQQALNVMLNCSQGHRSSLCDFTARWWSWDQHLLGVVCYLSLIKTQRKMSYFTVITVCGAFIRVFPACLVLLADHQSSWCRESACMQHLLRNTTCMR